jgi:SNF2 family DNA or RNA helicase
MYGADLLQKLMPFQVCRAVFSQVDRGMLRMVALGLMSRQIQGFQWLIYKHFERQSCILADDMGLGKT